MIISGTTLSNIGVYDASFNSNGALLYLDAGQSKSYSGSGTTWTDLSTNNNNATLVGAPTFTSSGSASYFTFNGTSQDATLVSSKFNQTYTGKTTLFAARFNSSAFPTTQYRCLFGVANGSYRNFNTYIYYSGSGFQLHFSANGHGGLSNYLSLTANQWFIGAATQTTSGVVTFYFNGQAVGVVTGQPFTQYLSNTTEAIALSDNYWYGDIALAAIYGRALSADEITQNYNSLRSRYGI
jgi:Concanavalin A-like lectin/glucanases superfamily